jgi:hypothetical protein
MVKRKRSYSGRDKAGAFAGLRSTNAELAGIIGVDEVLESRFRYQTGATTKSKIIDNAVWLYYAKQGLMADDPSNIKRFVTPTPSGKFRVYIENKLKRTFVTLEHYEHPRHPSTARHVHIIAFARFTSFSSHSAPASHIRRCSSEKKPNALDHTHS